MKKSVMVLLAFIGLVLSFPGEAAIDANDGWAKNDCGSALNNVKVAIDPDTKLPYAMEEIPVAVWQCSSKADALFKANYRIRFFQYKKLARTRILTIGGDFNSLQVPNDPNFSGAFGVECAQMNVNPYFTSDLNDFTEYGFHPGAALSLILPADDGAEENSPRPFAANSFDGFVRQNHAEEHYKSPWWRDYPIHCAKE